MSQDSEVQSNEDEKEEVAQEVTKSESLIFHPEFVLNLQICNFQLTWKLTSLSWKHQLSPQSNVDLQNQC